MTPTKIYAEILDGATLDQFYTAIKRPFVIQSALMPDAHLGYELPIGAVVATDNYVVPSWVGYDIGCGMCAVPTTFTLQDISDHAKRIYQGILSSVPVGFNHNDKAVDWINDHLSRSAVMDKIYNDGGANQLGTLGGGNHFIEIGFDENYRVWVIIHSGSRGVGHKLGSHYMALDGYGLDADSQDGKDYIDDAYFCQTFALYNRLEIIHRVINQMAQYSSGGAEWDKLINRNHNHVEEKDGQYIHRKGATHAEDGMMGVIPGNMRDGSFIVKGKGNPDSLCSSSHGAGRVLSRRKAKQELSVVDFQYSMSNITCNASASTLDESPEAYKNIFDVMEQQAELVDVVHHIKPIINVKG